MIMYNPDTKVMKMCKGGECMVCHTLHKSSTIHCVKCHGNFVADIRLNWCSYEHTCPAQVEEKV